jgi:WD40 repeat protein
MVGERDPKAESERAEQDAECDGGVGVSEQRLPTMSLWDKLESTTKIISAIAIPVVIAVGGWWIQSSITKQSISKDYVSLAITVLEKPKAEIDKSLRDWAVDLLDEYAPRKFPRETIAKLKSGSLDFSALAAVLISRDSNNVAIAPNGHLVATAGGDKVIRLFNLETGELLMTLQGHTAEVTALAFTPDSQGLFSGSFDQTARCWDIASGREVARFPVDAPVRGLSVTADNTRLVIGLTDNTFETFDVKSGKLLAQLKLEYEKTGRPYIGPRLR